MTKILFLLLATVAFGCQRNATDRLDATGTTDSSQLADLAANVTGEPATDTIILQEDRINNIILPFERKDMLTELKKEFKNISVTKETGEQDGPDFPLYSVGDGANEICFFAMDWEDTLKLDKVYIKRSLVKDQYGLRVGDGYQKIKTLRGDDVRTFTDWHQHTYAFFEASNIMYEISGDVFLPDTVDFENLKFTEEQIKDWTIEYIIWQNGDRKTPSMK